MQRSRFFVVEPSKVKTQHITLIEGFLQALTSSKLLATTTDVIFCASRSTFASLSPSTRAMVKHRQIPVMNPEKRRLIRKSLLEFIVVLRYVLGMREGDIVLVTCMLPPALMMLETVNRVLRRPNVHVLLHGELEGLFDNALQGIRSFGYWTSMWSRIRRPDSTLRLVVIDDFIKQKMLDELPNTFTSEQISVVHHPISTVADAELLITSKVTVCFIGYKTAFKGFDDFRHLSEIVPNAEFVAIGGGKIESLSSSAVKALVGSDGYLRAIASCSVAIFPYVGGYACSLSAAALDALSAGVHIVATPRPCFVSLWQHLGPDFVTICDSIEQVAKLMQDADWFAQKRASQEDRLNLLRQSKYGIDAVRASFEQLFQASEIATKGVA
jgi:glycosyltransferase involved in cell wall biosynthesis